MSAQVREPKGKVYYINAAISLFLMFVFPRIFAPIEPLTEQGMHAVGIFFGLLWAWCFVDFIWPSLLSIVAVGLSGFMGIGAAFTNGFGNATVIMLFFCFVFAGYLGQSGLCKSVTYWFISRKFCVGKPYVIITTLFFATFLMGSTAGSMPAVLISWAIVREIITVAGYERGDKMPMFLLIGVMGAAVLGQCVFPFRALAAVMINSLASFGFTMPWGTFVIASTITCVITLVLYIVVLRFIFRPDVKGLKSEGDIFSHYRTMIDYNMEQKIATVVLIFVIVGALAPSFFPAEWAVTKFFAKFTITSLIAVALSIVAIFTVGSGKGFDWANTIRSSVDWGTWIMIIGSMPSAALMQHADSGVTKMIGLILNSTLGDFSPFVAGLFFIIFATIVTQVAHNVVMVIVLSPVLGTLAVTMGFNPLAAGIFLAFGANMGLATPGASAWGAMIYGQSDWITSPKYAFMYTGTLCLIALIIMCIVGYPVAMSMIG